MSKPELKQTSDPQASTPAEADGKWISKAISPGSKGKLRASLDAKKGEPLAQSKLKAAAKAPGKKGQRARFALVLQGFRKGEKSK